MFKKLLVTAAVLASAAAQAQIAGSVGFTVTGTIVPSPCALTLSGNGIAAFGTLSTAHIKSGTSISSPDRYLTNVSEAKKLTLSVICSTPSKVALEFEDNRISSTSGVADSVRWGLGNYTPAGGAAQKIGAYTVNFSNTTIKATTASPAIVAAKIMYMTGAATAAGTWSAPLTNEASFLPPGKSLGLAALAAATTPDSLAEIKMEMSIGLEPLKSVVDTATSSITLDGSGTVTLIVL